VSKVVIGYQVGDKIVSTIELPFDEKDTILEVGCGETPLRHDEKWKTMDYRKLPNIDYVGDLEQRWPIEDNSFDGVYGTFVIEHMSWRKTPQFLSECFRVLKPGGKIYMVGPNTLEQCKRVVAKGDIDIELSTMIFGGQDEGGWNAHKAAFSPNFATKLFKDAGFTDIKVEPYIGAITDMTMTAMKPAGVYSSGIKLNIGSFIVMAKGWVNTDILPLEDFAKTNGYEFKQFDATKGIPYDSNSVNLIAASHFLEHITREEGLEFLKECIRVLKSDGVIRIAVPNARVLAKYYLKGKIRSLDNAEIKTMDDISAFIHMLIGGHKTVYDEDSLINTMTLAGFRKLELYNQGVSRSPVIQAEIKDMYPDHTLYVEGSKIDNSLPVMDKLTDPIIKINEEHNHAVIKDKLRIGLISTQFFGVPPTGYSGLERVVWDLAMGLSELGHYVRIFGPEGSKPVPNGSVVITGPMLDTVHSDWLKSEQNAYEVYKDKLSDLDIVHGHNWFGVEYTAKITNKGLKVCHTHHGHINQEYWAKSKPPFKLNFIAISKFMQGMYAQAGIDAEYAYNGIDMNKYKFQEKKGDRLIFVGRLDTFKQPMVAISVSKRTGIPLDIFGGSFVQDENYLKQVINSCDGKQIVMHLDASQDEKVQFLQNAKALLFPSKMLEPFGLVAIEAMACGTPVIALNDGAIKEVIGEQALIADNEDDMCKMTGMLGGFEPGPLRDFVDAHYNRVIAAKRYEQLYKRILSGNEW
jgi:predicted SAM-dependent methyltransferase/glycosyltransferase involved in cell wall biosynthesis